MILTSTGKFDRLSWTFTHFPSSVLVKTDRNYLDSQDFCICL